MLTYDGIYPSSQFYLSPFCFFSVFLQHSATFCSWSQWGAGNRANQWGSVGFYINLQSYEKYHLWVSVLTWNFHPLHLCCKSMTCRIHDNLDKRTIFFIENTVWYIHFKSFRHWFWLFTPLQILLRILRIKMLWLIWIYDSLYYHYMLFNSQLDPVLVMFVEA